MRAIITNTIYTRTPPHHSTIFTPPSLPTRYNPSHSLTSPSLLPPFVTLKTPLTSLAAPVPSSRTLSTLLAQWACCTVKAADSLSTGAGAAFASGCVAERNGPSAGVVRRVLCTAGWERRLSRRVESAVEVIEGEVARRRREGKSRIRSVLLLELLACAWVRAAVIFFSTEEMVFVLG